MKVTVTTASPDRRMVLPADLVAARAALSTTQARARIDAVGRMLAGDAGLRFEPWRQSYSLRLAGTDTTFLRLYSKPVESCTITDVDGGAITDFTLISNGAGIVDRAERNGGWGRLFTGSVGISAVPDPESEIDAWLATITAGWLMPGQVSTWAAATAYSASTASVSYGDTVGSWVRSADRRVLLRFECTTAGISDASEPAAFTATATAAGDTITDGTVVWTARAARELPEDLSEAALELALAIDSRRARDQSVISASAPGASVTYAAGGIPGSILDTVRAYR